MDFDGLPSISCLLLMENVDNNLSVMIQFFFSGLFVIPSAALGPGLIEVSQSGVILERQLS